MTGAERILRNFLSVRPYTTDDRLRALLEEHPDHADGLRLEIEAFLAWRSGLSGRSRPRFPPLEDGGTLVAGKSIAGFDLLELVGRGATAHVFRARQIDTGRPVALKVMRRTDARGATYVNREQLALGLVDHPSIPRILAAGQTREWTYLARPWLHGAKPLSKLLGDARAQVAAGWLRRWCNSQNDNDAVLIARVGRTLSAALAVAHEQGVLHRDLKPANVLLDRDGTPSLIDFGLAKVTDPKGTASTFGFVGSPAYAAPELFRRPNHTTQTEVFGLGAILFEMATLDVPYPRQTAEPPARANPTQSAAHHRLRRSLPALPPDFVSVVAKCIEYDPRDRYRSARELADDLDRFLNHYPVRARPLPRLQRVQRWIRREPRLALSTLMLVLAVLLVGSLYLRTASLAATSRAEKLRRLELAVARAEPWFHDLWDATLFLPGMEICRRYLAAQEPDPDPRSQLAAVRALAVASLLGAHRANTILRHAISSSTPPQLKEWCARALCLCDTGSSDRHVLRRYLKSNANITQMGRKLLQQRLFGFTEPLPQPSRPDPLYVIRRDYPEDTEYLGSPAAHWDHHGREELLDNLPLLLAATRDVLANARQLATRGLIRVLELSVSPNIRRTIVRQVTRIAQTDPAMEVRVEAGTGLLTLGASEPIRALFLHAAHEAARGLWRAPLVDLAVECSASGIASAEADHYLELIVHGLPSPSGLRRRIVLRRAQAAQAHHEPEMALEFLERYVAEGGRRLDPADFPAISDPAGKARLKSLCRRARIAYVEAALW